MTVCIAAMCQWEASRPVVIAATDRMITAGDIQFEPPATKIFGVTSSIFALTAGDASANQEIMDHTLVAVQQRLANDKSWMRVEEVADLTSLQVIEWRRKHAARSVLGPLGLTSHTFLTRQRDMTADWTDKVTDKLLSFDSGTYIITAGIDELGPHIWVVDGKGQTTCHDSVGFAATGYGRWHAESQFMFAGHARWKPFPETFLLAYTAKRRAEVAPGVGAATDMCMVMGLGGYRAVDPAELALLDSLYKNMLKGQAAAEVEANSRIAGVFKEISKQIHEKQAASSSPDMRPPETPEPDGASEKANDPEPKSLP